MQQHCHHARAGIDILLVRFTVAGYICMKGENAQSTKATDKCTGHGQVLLRSTDVGDEAPACRPVHRRGTVDMGDEADRCVTWCKE